MVRKEGVFIRKIGGGLEETEREKARGGRTGRQGLEDFAGCSVGAVRVQRAVFNLGKVECGATHSVKVQVCPE